MIQYNLSRIMNSFILCCSFIIILEINCVILPSRKFNTIINEWSANCKNCNHNARKAAKTFETSSYFKSNQVYEEHHWNNHESKKDDYGDTLSSSDLVSRQYENLPYPPFTEADMLKEEIWYKHETSTYVSFSSIRLEKVNHFLHKGEENFRKFYRIIVPGGGTGGVTVFASEQLRHTNAEIIYLDFSLTSMKISQRRARTRKLENIIWIHSWIEDVRYLGLGLFNDFSCSGVLHHLKSPLNGLNHLKDQIKYDGGMYIMVYGHYGRTGVYQIQTLMRLINTNMHEIKKEIKNTNLTLSILPEKNWFTNDNLNIRDHHAGDIGLYDLFLHKRDVAYSMKAIFNWLEIAGLHFIDFESIRTKYTLKLRHQTYHSQYMIRMISRMKLSQQLHITELLQGSVIKQDFYASKLVNSETDLLAPSSLLYIYGNPQNLRKSLTHNKNIETSVNQTKFRAKGFLMNVDLEQMNSRNIIKDFKNETRDFVDLIFPSNSFNHFLMSQLSFSNKGVFMKDVWKEYRKHFNSRASDNDLTRLTHEFYDNVKDTDMFLVKKRHVMPFPMTCFKTYYQISSY